MKPTTTSAGAAGVVRDRGRRRGRSILRHSRSTANRAERVERSWLRRASHTSLNALDAPHTVELWPAVAHILQVGVERDWLVVNAERHIRRILPELLLHFAADLLLSGEVRRVEPGFAQLFHFWIGRPAEPRISTAGADRDVRAGRDVPHATEVGVKNVPAAFVDWLTAGAPAD